MNKLLGLFAVFTLLFAATVANTDINFYFADILAGVGGGSGSGSGPSVPSNSTTADDVFAIEQTINNLFSTNDAASNDNASNVVYSTYAPLITPFASSSIVLTSSAPIVNNGATTTYNGISGFVSYLQNVAATRSSSRQVLTNLIYTFSGANSVTVTALFNGIESLNANSSFDTFYGHRSFQLVRDASGQYGWLITSLNIVRDVTRPSPDFTAEFTTRVQKAVTSLININDAASNDNASNVNVANYGAQVSALVTSDLTVSSTLPGSGTTTYGTSADSTAAGASAFIAFIRDFSATRASSLTAISNFDYNFNFDKSECTVNAKIIGYEVLLAGGQDIFFGTRTFTVLRGDDGVWRVSALVAVRSAAFSQ